MWSLLEQYRIKYYDIFQSIAAIENIEIFDNTENVEIFDNTENIESSFCSN